MNYTPFSFRRPAPDQGSAELTEEHIRLRAYQIYQQRGCQDGHDVEDWLLAEAEVFSNKAGPLLSQDEKEPEFAFPGQPRET